MARLVAPWYRGPRFCDHQSTGGGTDPPRRMVREQSGDPLCEQICTDLEDDRRPRFARREDGVLVLIASLDESEQIVVPSALRRRVLQMNHELAAAGHAGGHRTNENMRRGFYWPSMVADVYYTVHQCATCAKDRIDMHKHSTPLTLFPALAPSESDALDLLGPLPKSRRGEHSHPCHGGVFCPSHAGSCP